MDATRSADRSARPATSSGCSAAVIDRAHSEADTRRRRSSRSGALTAFGAEPFDVFLWAATIGTLILLFVYFLATIGAIKLLFFSGEAKVPAWQIVIPIGALIVVGYTLYRNVWPYPTKLTDDGGTNAAFYLPIVCAIWILLAVLLVVGRPELARRAGQKLTAEEGLAPEKGPAGTVPAPAS